MTRQFRTHLPVSDHFDGRRFFNPGVDTDKSFGDLIRWRRMQQRAVWPRHITNEPYRPFREPAADEMVLTFVGHATYLIRMAGLTLLTDPVFSDRASPFSFVGPHRVRNPGLSLDDLPRVDVVLLSHNHYDHMDLPTLRALHKRWRPTIVTGLRNGAYLAGKGVGPSVELDWWERAEPKPGLGITYVPAQHWSSRTMLDRRTMLWGGHFVETPAGPLYFAGDTGYFGGFREIRARLGAPAVSILPIGAYEPRWFMKSQHMNPDEAARAHRELGSSRSLAAHWGTFQLTDEGIEEPIRALEKAIVDHAIPPSAFVAPLPGQSVLWRRTPPDESTRFS